MARDTARPRVLLTGFGPFPGVPENPSGWLAEALADRAAPAFDVHGHVLPTEWDAVAALAPRLHTALQPHVTIHFGVSASAKGLRIERMAHNRAASRPDACGAKPATKAIVSDGAAILETALPVTALAAHLRARGHTAHASRSCGRYLCNFLYYRSLERTQWHGGDALFVHVPLTEAQGGTLSRDALLAAAHETMVFVLDAVQSRRPRDVRPMASLGEVRQ
jgi:pyroglutamyl-peptidase